MRPRKSPDSLPVNISIRQSWSVTVVLLGVAVGAIFGYAISDNEQHKETIDFATSAFYVATVAAGAVHAYRGLVELHNSHEEAALQRKNDRMIERSIHYIQRWNGRDYREARKKVAEICKKEESGEITSVVEYLSKNPDAVQDVTNILNFLEELSGVINWGIVDRELSLRFYRYIIIRCHEVFSRYIMKRRKSQENKLLYQEFSTLYGQISSNTNGHSSSTINTNGINGHNSETQLRQKTSTGQYE